MSIAKSVKKGKGAGGRLIYFLSRESDFWRRLCYTMYIYVYHDLRAQRAAPQAAIRRREKQKGSGIMKIYVADDYKSMSRKAANLVSAQIILKPNCVLGLATGSTPIGLYEQLADWYEKGDLDFTQVKTVNLDEYVGLRPDHPQSYRYFMQKNLFSRVNIQLANTHVPNGMADDIEAECRRYTTLIHDMGGIDVQVLGMGHNGHIGFNEPGEAFELE